MPKFVLASASPARLKLLRMAGIEPIVQTSYFDESQIQIDYTEDLVNTLAFKKAEIVAKSHSSSLVLGCDSVLAIEGEIYGKPENPSVAIERWRQMRGKVGLLYTGHALMDTSQQTQLIKCGITEVHFADIDDDAIEAYVATGEPLKCAGSFALEGKGGVFVEKIVGCHTNVIGLSLPLLRQMLEEMGYQISNFW